MVRTRNFFVEEIKAFKGILKSRDEKDIRIRHREAYELVNVIDTYGRAKYLTTTEFYNALANVSQKLGVRIGIDRKNKFTTAIATAQKSGVERLIEAAQEDFIAECLYKDTRRLQTKLDIQILWAFLSWELPAQAAIFYEEYINPLGISMNSTDEKSLGSEKVDNDDVSFEPPPKPSNFLPMVKKLWPAFQKRNDTKIASNARYTNSNCFGDVFGEKVYFPIIPPFQSTFYDKGAPSPVLSAPEILTGGTHYLGFVNHMENFQKQQDLSWVAGSFKPLYESLFVVDRSVTNKESITLNYNLITKLLDGVETLRQHRNWDTHPDGVRNSEIQCMKITERARNVLFDFRVLFGNFHIMDAEPWTTNNSVQLLKCYIAFRYALSFCDLTSRKELNNRYIHRFQSLAELLDSPRIFHALIKKIQ